MSESSNSLAREPTRTTTVRSTDTTTPRTGYDASTVAETLLRAFYAQDEREACIRAGDAAGATHAANTARDLMGEAFAAEFPHVPESEAHLAGVRFVEALFVQDEIENRDDFAAAVEGGLDATLLLTDATPRDGPLLDDARWDLVESYLDEVCEYAGIDGDYAEAQTRFWKLHGQQMNWMDAAATAHQIKVESMLDGAAADPGDVARLADYFVAGVAGHDQWADDQVEAVDGVVGLVTTYYDELFTLRDDE
jgi:hypothetical protein